MSYYVPHSGSVIPGTRLSQSVNLRTRSDVNNLTSTFTGNGTSVAYITGFQIPATGLAELVVYIDRKRMSPATDFTVNATTNTVTFTVAPRNNTFIKVIAVSNATAIVTHGLVVSENNLGTSKQGTFALTGAGNNYVILITSVTANSRIFITAQLDGGTPGWYRIVSRVPGVSFTIATSSSTDTSTIAFEMFEPA